MKIDDHEYTEVDIPTVQKYDIVVWTNKRGQHTNRVIEVCGSRIKLEKHMGGFTQILLSDIKKCWRLASLPSPASDKCC